MQKLEKDWKNQWEVIKEFVKEDGDKYAQYAYKSVVIDVADTRHRLGFKRIKIYSGYYVDSPVTMFQKYEGGLPVRVEVFATRDSLEDDMRYLQELVDVVDYCNEYFEEV